MGLAIAKRFAQEGADVVICDVDGDALESAVRVFGVAGLPLVGALSANVASRAEVRSAVECAAAGSGQLDILVAQAGIAALGPFLEVEDATWHRIVDVNLNGLFYSVQEGARRMPAGGSVVVTSSTNASYVEAHTVPYSTSKGAAVTFVRATALDLAVHGIRINAICPGIIRTRLSAVLTKDPVAGPEYLKTIPLGRWGEPDDIADTALFLASAESSYMTGQALIVDGGVTLGVTLDVPDGPLGTDAHPAR